MRAIRETSTDKHLESRFGSVVKDKGVTKVDILIFRASAGNHDGFPWLLELGAVAIAGSRSKNCLSSVLQEVVPRVKEVRVAVRVREYSWIEVLPKTISDVVGGALSKTVSSSGRCDTCRRRVWESHPPGSLRRRRTTIDAAVYLAEESGPAECFASFQIEGVCWFFLLFSRGRRDSSTEEVIDAGCRVAATIMCSIQ